MVAWSEVGLVVLYEVRVGLDAVAEGIEEGGLKARETIVEPGDVGPCEAEGLRVALGGETVDVRAAGVGETHHLGALVEGFAGGIVDGASENLHVVVAAHEDNLRVAAAHQQA